MLDIWDATLTSLALLCFEDTDFAEAATETMVFDELFDEENLPEVNIGTNPVSQKPERFGFVQELGEGAYGKVWKAKKQTLFFYTELHKDHGMLFLQCIFN